jgi:2-methylisocitrate lyase-like PEP mutase family enzyme
MRIAMTTPSEFATTFHRLHQGPEILILANAWDAGSARLAESLGARAIATTSAAVAWAHGYPDGDVLPVDLVAWTVASIARAIRIPLTADIEGGYSDDPKAVGEAVARVVDAGAVGINLEDGSSPPDLLAAKIAAAKAAASRRGVDLFVNARADVYLRGLKPAGERVDETLARARRYKEAGASGLFVPGVTDPAEIQQIASGAGLPLNVLARPGLPPAAELAPLGVRRLSAGSGIAQAVWGRTAALTRAFLADGRSEAMAEGAMVYPEINALMTQR